jgi:hypothetical protein
MHRTMIVSNALELSELTAIGPLDGRYGAKVRSDGAAPDARSLFPVEY